MLYMGFIPVVAYWRLLYELILSQATMASGCLPQGFVNRASPQTVSPNTAFASVIPYLFKILWLI